jgi:tellurite resistance protein TehA-like permease
VPRPLRFWSVLQRVPLRYETALWSLVFPIGMYGVATRELGRTTGTSWLVTVGDDEG